MKTIRLALVFVFMFTGCCLYAQNKYTWQQASSGGYSFRYVTNDPMETRFYTLKNGLTVILSPNKTEPRITVRIAVRAGSNNDPADHTGLAHYLEHLLFKGTDKYGTLDWAKEKPLLEQIDGLYEQYNTTTDPEARKEIYKKIDQVSREASESAIANEYSNMMTSLGSQRTNAHTSVEETVYEEDIPSNVIDKFLEIQAERFRNPVIRLFHTELEAVYEEKNRGLDNDGNKMQEAMFSTIFPKHKYGLQTTIGTIEHLKNPSIKAIRAFYNQYYVPNNMAIIMTGDFNPDELIKKIDKHFGYMTPKPVEEYKGAVEAPVNGPIVKEVFGPSAESIRVLFRAPASGTRDAMLCAIIRAILYNGKAGLLDVNLNKQQQVLGAGAALWQFRDYGIFILLASPRQSQTLEDAKDLLLSQIKSIREGNFDESLISATAANYKLNLLQSLDNNTARAEDMRDQFIKNRGTQWDKSVAFIDEMQKISKQEIVAFAKTFFTDKNYVILYKRKGVDENSTKVEKPAISPIETNAGKSSPFVTSILAAVSPPVEPVWISYKKEIHTSTMGIAEVLYVPNKKNSLFRLSYRFDMGSWNNKLLPVATQYLQYLGTEKNTAEDISRKFYNIACNFNIATGTDQTTITISGLQENFDQAVRLFEMLLTQCVPDETALAELKKSIIRSRSNSKLNKSAIAAAQQSYAMYGPRNPFNYVLNNEELENLKAADLMELLHSLNTYAHTIAYYGPETLTSLVLKLKAFHKIPATWKATVDAIKFERLSQTKAEVIFTGYDAVQAEVYWIRNLDNYKPEKEGLVNLFNNYFGAGMGSVVFKTIRESRALAYSTSARVLTPSKKDDQYSIVAYVGCQADKLNEAVTGMNELLNEFPGIDQSFKNARQSLITDIETDRIAADRMLGSYLNAKRMGIDHDIRKDNYIQYKMLKLEDLSVYHRQHLSGKPFIYCVIASDKKINLDDLKKYGELKILSLEQLFGY